jgi:hypothetical protein
MVKSPSTSNAFGPVRTIFLDPKVIVYGEEIFTRELAGFHAASRVHAVCLNCYFEDAGRHIRRREGQRGVPLVELAGEGYARLYRELDAAVGRRDRVLGYVGEVW